MVGKFSVVPPPVTVALGRGPARGAMVGLGVLGRGVDQALAGQHLERAGVFGRELGAEFTPAAGIPHVPN
jgi:hypothetical protein